jgi:undecaprenyl-diphosphatase
VIDIVILAVVQGVAEFLPISSSGHLVILGALIGAADESATLEIILHTGTLGSILVVYWRRILALLRSDRRVIPLLVVGTIPAAVLGLVIKSQFESILTYPILAGCMLIITGLMLVVLGRLAPGEKKYRSMSLLGSFAVGCFQAFAILPGISRSGSTILGGRLMGLNNEDSVTFSFLLAIPAILGATVLAVKDVVEQPSTQQPVVELLAGAVVAFFVGILALRWLIVWSRQDRLSWFAWWCIPMGIAVILLFEFGMIK